MTLNCGEFWKNCYEWITGLSTGRSQMEFDFYSSRLQFLGVHECGLGEEEVQV